MDRNTQSVFFGAQHGSKTRSRPHSRSKHAEQLEGYNLVEDSSSNKPPTHGIPVDKPENISMSVGKSSLLANLGVAEKPMVSRTKSNRAGPARTSAVTETNPYDILDLSKDFDINLLLPASLRKYDSNVSMLQGGGRGSSNGSISALQSMPADDEQDDGVDLELYHSIMGDMDESDHSNALIMHSKEYQDNIDQLQEEKFDLNVLNMDNNNMASKEPELGVSSVHLSTAAKQPVKTNLKNTQLDGEIVQSDITSQLNELQLWRKDFESKLGQVSKSFTQKKPVLLSTSKHEATETSILDEQLIHDPQSFLRVNIRGENTVKQALAFSNAVDQDYSIGYETTDDLVYFDDDDTTNDFREVIAAIDPEEGTHAPTEHEIMRMLDEIERDAAQLMQDGQDLVSKITQEE